MATLTQKKLSRLRKGFIHAGGGKVEGLGNIL
jgi:hypothetical protein